MTPCKLAWVVNGLGGYLHFDCLILKNLTLLGSPTWKTYRVSFKHIKQSPWRFGRNLTREWSSEKDPGGEKEHEETSGFFSGAKGKAWE